MEAQIIVEDEKGIPWILVPEKNIRIRVYSLETGEPRMVPVRIEGENPYYNRFLRENFRFTSKLDIPDEIVQFAVEKEQRTHAAVHAALERSKSGILKCFKGWQSPAPLKGVCNALAAEPDKATEIRLSENLLKLVPEGGGLN